MRKATKENMKKLTSLLLILAVIATCILPNFATAIQAKAETVPSTREEIESLEGITIDENGFVTREETAELLTIHAENIVAETETTYETNDGLTIQKADVTQETIDAYELIKQEQEAEAEAEAARIQQEAEDEDSGGEQIESLIDEEIDSYEEENLVEPEEEEEEAEETTEAYTISEEEYEKYSEELEKLEEEIISILEDDDSDVKMVEETNEVEKDVFNAPGDSYTATQIEKYITSIVVEKRNTDGTWSTLSSGDTVTNQDMVRATLSWSIDGASFGTNRGKTYTYQLPSGFTMGQSTSGNVLSGADVVGKFNIDSDSLVHITYNDDYNKENSNTHNRMVALAYASSSDIEDGNKIIFDWGNGQVEIIVETDGDYTVEKTASKLTTVMADQSEIEYTVVIDTEAGTGDTITIQDTLTTEGTFKKNNVTYSAFDSVTYDTGSFKLTKSDGTTVSLTADNLVVDNENKTFTITDVPALGKGEQYTLTYKVNVAQNHDATVTGVVNNSVEATVGDKERTDNASIRYPVKITKSDATYNLTTEEMYWTVDVYTTGQSVEGYTFTDTAERPFAKNQYGNYKIGLYAMDVNGNQLSYQNISTQISTFTISEDKKTFSFVFPEAPEKAVRWRIAYYTEATADGTSRFTVKNTATVITPNKDNQWSDDGTGIGRPWTPTLSKNNTGIGEKNEKGIVPLTWKYHIDFKDAILSTADDNVSFTDRIGAAKQLSTGTTSSSLHYAYYKEIEEDYKNNLFVTIVENGKEKELSYNEAVEAGISFTFAYWDSGWKDVLSYAVAQRPTVKVKYTRVTIKKGTYDGDLQIKSVDLKNYRTYFDTKNYQDGEIWELPNQIDANGISVTDTVRYTESDNEITKAIGIPTEKTHEDKTAPTRWQTGEAELDYDNTTVTVNGEEKALVYYRITVQADETGDIEITDKLPEGLTLAIAANWSEEDVQSILEKEQAVPVWAGDGSFDLGPYNGAKVNLGDKNGWALNKEERYSGNLTWTLHEDGSFTIKIKNRGETSSSGNKLFQADSTTGMIGLTYTAYVDNWDALSEYVKATNGKAIEVVNLSNTATLNGKTSSSVDAQITRDRTVINKGGEQVIESGATTAAASYQIRINESGLDLLEGSDVLTLTDTIRSSTLKYTLDEQSIKLYAMNADGEKGDDVTIDKIQISNPTEENGEYIQTITLEIKDATAYILEYTYNVTEVIDGTNSGILDNRAEINGLFYDSSQVEQKGLNALVVTNYGALTIQKADAKNSTNFLDDAKFELQKYNAATDSFEKVDEFTMPDGEKGKLYDYTSDSNIVQADTLYRLVETKAPEGYVIDENNHYFIIGGNKGSETDMDIRTKEESLTAALGTKTTVAGVSVEELTSDSDYFHYYVSNRASKLRIENEKETMDLDVTKVWADNLKGEEVPVDVQLYEDGVLIGTVTLNEGNQWYYKWEKLSLEKTYEVKEVVPEDKANIWKDPVYDESVTVSNVTKEIYKGSSSNRGISVSGSNTKDAHWTLCLNGTYADPSQHTTTEYSYTKYDGATMSQLNDALTNKKLSDEEYLQVKRALYYFLDNYVSANGEVKYSSAFDALQRVVRYIVGEASNNAAIGDWNQNAMKAYYGPIFKASLGLSADANVTAEQAVTGTWKSLSGLAEYEVSDAEINEKLVLVLYEATENAERIAAGKTGKELYQNLLTAYISDGTQTTGTVVERHFSITNEKKFLAVLPETGSRAWKSLLGLGMISALAAGLWLAYRNRKIFF